MLQVCYEETDPVVVIDDRFWTGSRNMADTAILNFSVKRCSGLPELPMDKLVTQQQSRPIYGQVIYFPCIIPFRVITCVL